MGKYLARMVSKFKLLVFFFIMLAAALVGLSYLPAVKKSPKAESLLLSFRKMVFSIPTPFGMAARGQWMPDGKSMIFSAARFSVGGEKLWSLYALDPATRKIGRIARFTGRDEIERFIPSPRGTFLAVQFSHAGNSYVKLLNVETGAFFPLPNPANEPFQSVSFADSPMAFLPDGKKLLFAGYDSNGSHLCLYDMDSGESTLLGVPENASDGTWSPAGDRILFLVSQGESSSVMTASPDGSNAAPFYPGGENCCALFSPYGGQIAFLQKGKADGTSTLAVMQADGSERDFTRGLPPEVRSLSWSPDGGTIFFQARNGGGPWEIYAYQVKDASLQKLTFKGENLFPEESPAGNALVYISDQGVPGLYALYQEGENGGKNQRLTGWFFL